MSLRHIILTGAPVSSSLGWDESGLLQPQDLGLTSAHQETDDIRWRSLEPVRTAAIVVPPVDEGGTFSAAGAIQRYSGESVSGLGSVPAFYDHSFAFHEGASTLSFDETWTFNEDSGLEDSLSVSDSVNDATSGAQIWSRCRPSDISGLPDATYIQGLAPRTMTVDLIVAVIEIEPCRRIRTRWGRSMDIIELVVGDETQSGFRVSCWMAPPDDEGAGSKARVGSALAESLQNLRPCDLILLRSVALNSFRDQVYGQSLRNNATKIDLLHRRPADATGSDGIYPGRISNRDSAEPADLQTAKIARVKTWALESLGPVRHHDRGHHQQQQHQHQTVALLPPDTQ